MEIYTFFEDEYYKVSGNNFKLEIKISLIVKVEKTKHWIYLSTVKGYAQFLKTGEIFRDDQIILKEIFDQNKVKNNL